MMNEPFFAIVARNKTGGNPDWHWCTSELVGRDFLITGGVPEIVTRGPNKGRRRWSAAKKERVIVTRAECDAARAEYTAKTGNCAECRGSGRTLWKWSKDDGVTYRDCRECSGSGLAEVKP